MYYIAALYFALTMLLHGPHPESIAQLLPLWPISWLPLFPVNLGIGLIYAILSIGTLAAAIFPHGRIARTLAFIGLLEYAALASSFGKINHGYHLWVLTSLLLIFLPGGWVRQASLTGQQKGNYLCLFWGCQGMILLVYTMSGLWKVQEGFIQLFHGQANAFSPDALALQTADGLLQTRSQTLLGPLFIAHPLLGWPVYLGTICLELLSIVMWFRPSLHKLWAIGLIGMHLGIYLTMGIPFIDNILLLALFFFASPFVAKRRADAGVNRRLQQAETSGAS